MTGHEYLSQLLDQQKLSQQQEDALRDARVQIESALRQRLGAGPRFYYGGSFGKRTMVKASYDLDLVMYFPSETRDALATIFASVRSALTSAGYTAAYPKNVAIRVPGNGGFHVDVVPGKAQDATFEFATLYKSKEQTTLQTSLKRHIEAIRHGSIRDDVKLMKLWRIRRGLDWSTFALELTVGRALDGCRLTALDDRMKAVLVFIRDNITAVRLVDPANSNNVVEMDAATRYALKQAAATSLTASYWSGIVS